MSIQWYTVHTYVGYEDRVKANIEKRARALHMEDKIFQVLIPIEEVGSGERTVKQKLFPGYVFVEMDLGDDPREPNEAWEVVRNTPGVTGFVGAGGQPVPLTESEVWGILRAAGILGEPETRTAAPAYRAGDVVQVIAGPFTDFTGVVSEISPERGKVKVLVSIFGRETPVELEFTQVARV